MTCLYYIIDKDCQSLLSLFRRGEAMATLNISIPAAMRKWIDEQVGSGEYANASDYMRDLIRHDQRQRESLVLDLIEGERSGISRKKIKDIMVSAKNKLKNG